MNAMASQITSLTIVYSTVSSGTDQRKHQSSASLAFVQGIHRRPVNYPHKGSVTRKMFPFDDVIIYGMSFASRIQWSPLGSLTNSHKGGMLIFSLSLASTSRCTNNHYVALLDFEQFCIWHVGLVLHIFLKCCANAACGIERIVFAVFVNKQTTIPWYVI